MKKRLSSDEGLKLLKEYGTPEHVIRHCIAVTDTAVAIGRALNKAGYSLDIDLIQGAAIIHDIARVEDKHWEVGADIAKKLGYDDEADIIRVHMFYPEFSPIDKANETDMVCLGDRLVKEDRYVGLDERIDYVINKARKKGAGEDVINNILKKKHEAGEFIRGIERKTGRSIDDIALGKDN